MTRIEWTERTWNPVTGCTPISSGCNHCYARVMARRCRAMGLHKYRNGFDVTLHDECIDEPKAWRKGSLIFVCSMGDLFHNDVPDGFIDRVMQVIRETPWHTYQILTKRASRMRIYFKSHPVPDNVWLGVTVENRANLYRKEILVQIPATVRFLSCEPLLGPLGELDLNGIHWVIAGGESGPQARPASEWWFTDIRDEAAQQGVPFFFKQWGTWGPDGVRRSKAANGCLLQGEKIQQWPEPDRVD